MPPLWVAFLIVTLTLLAPQLTAVTIVDVTPSTTTVERFDRLELTVELADVVATNPYDSYSSSSTGIRLRGFFFTSDFSRAINQEGFWDGSTWRIRFHPDMVGNWGYLVSVLDAGNDASYGDFNNPDLVTCIASTRRGWVYYDGHLLRAVTTGGPHPTTAPFVPVGYNNGWQPDVEQPSFAAAADAGVDLISFWLAMPWARPSFASVEEPWWDDRAALENIEDGLGNYNQAACTHIDGMVERAEATGVTLLPALWSHGQLRDASHPWSAGGNHWWADNAYSTVCTPETFFVRQQAGAGSPATEQWQHQYNFISYCMARWGASPAIAGWIPVVELEGTNGWRDDPALVREWCAAVAALIDDRDHYRPRDDIYPSVPVGASLTDEATPNAAMVATGMPLVCLDSYLQQDDPFAVGPHLAGLVRSARDAQDGPVLVTEFGGLTAQGGTQPTHLRRGAWSGLASGAAATPLVWCDGGGFPLLTEPAGVGMLGTLEQLALVRDAVTTWGDPTAIPLDDSQATVSGTENELRVMATGEAGFGWVGSPLGDEMADLDIAITDRQVGNYEVVWYDTRPGGTSVRELTYAMDGHLALVVPATFVGLSDVAFRFGRTDTACMLETGVLTWSSDLFVPDGWDTVTFRGSFTDPVVLLGTLPHNGKWLPDREVTRVQGVSPTGFSWRFESFVPTGTVATDSPLPWLAVESGRHVLSDGAALEAGTAEPGPRDTQIRFERRFRQRPVVICQLLDEIDPDTKVIRPYQITHYGFSVRLQGVNTPRFGRGGTARIAWVAIEPGAGLIQPGVPYEAGMALPGAAPDEYLASFTDGWANTGNPPIFFAGMQTMRDRDPACVRLGTWRPWDTPEPPTTIPLMIDEVGGNTHKTEQVGWFLLLPDRLVLTPAPPAIAD